MILVRPHGSSMGMLVVEYGHGELDLVEMELNGAALAKWLHHPKNNNNLSIAAMASGIKQPTTFCADLLS